MCMLFCKWYVVYRLLEVSGGCLEFAGGVGVTWGGASPATDSLISFV